MSRFFRTLLLMLLSAMPFMSGSHLSFAEIAASGESNAKSAVTTDFQMDRVEIGVKGVFKTGYWVPCRVVFDGTLPVHAHVTFITLDPDGTPTCFTAVINDSARDGHASASALVRFGRENATLTVRVEAGDDISNRSFLAERVFSPSREAASKGSLSNSFFPAPVPMEQPIYLLLAADDPGVEGAFAHMTFRENNRPILVALKSLNDLPDDPIAFEMLSTIILSANPDLYAGVTSDNPQLLAMKRWLRLGGRVIFNAGKNSETLVSGDDALFADFLPGKFERMASLRLSSPFEVYISQFQNASVAPINMTGSADAPFIETPFFSEPQGVIEASDRDLPLILRVPVGLGSLVYMGGDLDQAPLRNWRDRSILVAKLLGVSERTAHTQQLASGNALMQLGYNDLSGQLRSALDQFDNVKGISFTFVMILLVVYLVVIGIGDWFLVHKLLKRPQLTWLTFPCWVLLFCLIAAMIARHTQVDDIIVNQAELIDFDTVDGTVRGTAWLGIFSPKDQACHLRFATGGHAQQPEIRFAWFGLPGKALGGMSPQTVSLAQWDTTYRLGSPGEEIINLPMQTRATRSLMANWSTTDGGDMPVVAELAEQEGVPCGYVMNVSPYHLQQCFIVYGRWVIELNEIKAGAAVEVSTATKKRNSQTAFTGGRSIFAEDRPLGYSSSGSYNTESTSIPYIMQSMMFYQAAGGIDEFALRHAYQHSVDMSNLLPTKRAILIGIVAVPEKADKNGMPGIGSQILRTVDGVEQPLGVGKRVTFLRAVLAVQNDGRNAR